MTKVATKELQVIDLDNVDIKNLKEIQGFKKSQEDLVLNNPYVEIIDSASYETAKQNRTSLRKGRTNLQNQEKDIVSKITGFRKAVGSVIINLIDITKPHEEKQQKEIDRWEEIKEKERAEKARLEEERQNKIKGIIDEFFSTWKEKINLLEFKEIEAFPELIQSASENLEDLEEFEYLLDDKMEVLVELFKEKRDSLREKEKQRLESEKLAKEQEELRKEKARLQAIEEERLKKESRDKKRREQLNPYIMFIRDYEKTFNLPDEQFQQELNELKEVALQHLESEAIKKKKEEEAKEKFEKERAELEAERLEIRSNKRVNELKSLGFIQNQTSFSLEDVKNIPLTLLQTLDDTAWEDLKFEIQEAIDLKLANEEQQKKESAIRLKREKAFKPDLELLDKTIDSISVTESLISENLKNQESIDFYNQLLSDLEAFKQDYKSKLSNII